MKNFLPILFLLILVINCGGSSNTNNTEENNEDDTPSPNAGLTISMTTPYVSATDIDRVNGNYSETGDNPHDGIDFIPAKDQMTYQAVSSGTIDSVTLAENEHTGNWQVGVNLAFNETYTVEYKFEPMSDSTSDGTTQEGYIQVSEGDTVATGDVIGYLLLKDDYSHVHFGLRKNNETVCPETYFDSAAQTSLTALIQEDNPSWEICN
ncbi:MAG: hypothetical protein ABII18_00630 [bacterium]